MPKVTTSTLVACLRTLVRPTASVDLAPGVDFDADLASDGEAVILRASHGELGAFTSLRLPTCEVRALERPSASGVGLLRRWQWALLFQLDDRMRLELGIRGDV